MYRVAKIVPNWLENPLHNHTCAHLEVGSDQSVLLHLTSGRPYYSKTSLPPLLRSSTGPAIRHSVGSNSGSVIFKLHDQGEATELL